MTSVRPNEIFVSLSVVVVLFFFFFFFLLLMMLMMMVLPGPLAPGSARPRRKMTARSYSCTTWKVHKYECKPFTILMHIVWISVYFSISLPLYPISAVYDKKNFMLVDWQLGTHIRHWTRSPLVQVMARRLFRYQAITWANSVLFFNDPSETNQEMLHLITKFVSRKYIRKWPLQNVARDFVQTPLFKSSGIVITRWKLKGRHYHILKCIFKCPYMVQLVWYTICIYTGLDMSGIHNTATAGSTTQPL